MSENTTTDSPPSPEDLPAVAFNESNEHQNSDEPPVSSKQRLLAKIEYLAGLGLAGIVPTARVNTAHGCLRTVLQHLDVGTATSNASALQDEVALKALRESPELLNLLKPILTAEQLKLIIREASLD